MQTCFAAAFFWGALLGISLQAGASSQDGPIHKAAAEGDLGRLVALVKEAPDSVNARGAQGQRPLHYAMSGDGAAVSFLLARGADPSAKDDRGRTPLHVACEVLPDDRAAQWVDIFRLKRADANVADAAGETPLHVAARGGKAAAASALLRAGTDANVRNKKGATPLAEAAKAVAPSAAADAAAGPHAALVLLLLPHTQEVKGVEVGGEPLAHFVVRYGSLEQLESLVDREDAAKVVDLDAKNAQGETPLQMAAAAGDAARVALLASAGADVHAADSSERTSLYGAAWDGQLEMAGVLLAAGAKADGPKGGAVGADAANSTPLHAAAWQGHTPLVRLLIAHGATLDARDSDGVTALHKAAWQGHGDLVGQLLAAGADAAAKDRDGFTALDKARSRSKEEAAKIAGIKRSYGPEQAAGPPDTPNPGDQGTSWASLGADDKDEWLTLDYPTAVQPARIDIYENYCPGAVVKITAVLDDGREVELWSGTDPTAVGTPNGVSKIEIKKKQKTNRIKLYIASIKVPGWNEIDAVGLIDAAGATQWATRAQSSTTYASGPPPENRYVRVMELLEGAGK